MQELLKALTEFLKEATLYLETKNKPLLPLRTGRTAEEVLAAVPKTEKEEPSLEGLPSAPSSETKRGRGRPKTTVDKFTDPTTPVKQAELTEDESTKAVYDAAKAVVQRFQKSIDDKPEGFHLVKRILAEDFKVAKLADLVHVARLEFIAKAKAVIAEADKMVVTV